VTEGHGTEHHRKGDAPAATLSERDRRRAAKRAQDVGKLPNPRAAWALVKDAASQWMEDKAPRLGAALAYYTVISLAPLLVIVIAIAGFFFGHEAAAGQLSNQIQHLVGPEGGKAVEAMVTSAAERPSSGTFASIAGVFVLLFGAAGLFGQLQDSLNTVWEVKPKPGRGIMGFIRDRFLSFTMVLGTAFLLLVSLAVSAALSALGGMLGDWGTSIIGQIVNLAIDVVVITVLFAMIYKFLPDAIIAWRDVWFGAGVTAVLFIVGKYLIGLYLGHASAGSAYGAAGSLVVLLIWLYYSSQIFLFGAELTKAYADRYGDRIVPKGNAVPVTDEDRAQEGAPRTEPAKA
jgi:membrane protein